MSECKQLLSYFLSFGKMIENLQEELLKALVRGLMLSSLFLDGSSPGEGLICEQVDELSNFSNFRHSLLTEEIQGAVKQNHLNICQGK